MRDVDQPASRLQVLLFSLSHLVLVTVIIIII